MASFAAFLALTFGLTWLLDLAIYLCGGLAATPGAVTILQFQMLLPARIPPERVVPVGRIRGVIAVGVIWGAWHWPSSSATPCCGRGAFCWRRTCTRWRQPGGNPIRPTHLAGRPRSVG
jgi:hypothetical protein